jgi:hypothetical protein
MMRELMPVRKERLLMELVSMRMAEQMREQIAWIFRQSSGLPKETSRC